MLGKALILAVVAALLLVSGCGESEDLGPGHMHQGQMERRMEGHRAAMRARHRAMMRQARVHRQAMMARRHHRQMMRRHRAAMRRLHAEEAAQRAAEAEEASTESASACDPNYSGACLDPYASDYDCEGGSGNGPDYTGEVTVVGVDHYGLDADGDGIGCEAE
jgi:hypothetical protein